MRVAYSYLRFSTPEQIEGDSIRRQSTKTKDWCDRKGVHLDTTLSFEDLGRSAFTGNHFNEGALGIFFGLVKDSTIKPGSYLVIESLDRFSRENPMTAAGRLFELVKAGITVVTVDDEREYSPESLGGSDSTAMLILVIKLAQAHAESVRKSQLIGPAWEKKKALARSEGRPLTSRGPQWLELKDGRFVERPDRVEIVRRIFRETIAGYGRREIVRRLNADGIQTFRADENRKRRPTGWQMSSVAKIIQNRMVLGEYQPHVGTHKAKNRRPDGEPIKDYYPRIIDDETYWRAQAALGDRRQQTGGRRGDKGAHILRGLAKCASCGGPMHVVDKGKPPKGGVYLVCSGNRRNTGCDNGRAWRVDKLEEAVLLCLTSFKTQSFESLNSDATDHGQRVDALRAELDDLNRRNKVLMRLAESEDEQAEARFLENAKEIKAKKKELKAAEAELGTRQSDPGDAARLAEILQLSTGFFKTKGEERLESRIRLSSLIRRIVDVIECDPVRGAYMVLPIDTKIWRVNRPTEGAYAYQLDLHPRAVDAPPPRFLFLLVKNPTGDARDAFYQGKGGQVMTADGIKGFPSPHAFKSRQK